MPVRVVTSDRLLRDRCCHGLPRRGRVVKPFGAPRAASHLARLRLEPRSEAFCGRLHPMDEGGTGQGGPFGGAGVRSDEERRRLRRKRQRKGPAADEQGSDRIRAASELHTAVKTWCASRGGSGAQGVDDDDDCPARCFVDWFQNEYEWAEPLAQLTTPIEEGAHKRPQEHEQQKRTQLIDDGQLHHRRSLFAWWAAVVHWLLAVFAALRLCRKATEVENVKDEKRAGEEEHEAPVPPPKVEAGGGATPTFRLEVERTPEQSAAIAATTVDWRVPVVRKNTRTTGGVGDSTSMQRPLTVCLVSDTHGFEAHCPALPAADVLIHCGDFCNEYDGDAKLDAWLASAKCDHIPHKIVVRGNHDAPNWRSNRGVKVLKESGAFLVGLPPKAAQTPGAIFHIGGVTFLALPFDSKRDGQGGGSLWGNRKSSKKQLQRLKQTPALPLADVILSHAPPRGVLDLTAKGEHIGSTSLLELVAAPVASAATAADSTPPALWAFGHVHEQRGGVRLDLEAARKGAASPKLRVHGAAVVPRAGDTERTTLFLNASNANDGRAACWPKDRRPVVVELASAEGLAGRK